MKFFVLFWLTVLMPYASAMPLKIYIASVIKNDEAVINQKAALAEAEASYEIAADLWATNLGLTPSYRNFSQNFESQSSSSAFELSTENSALQGELTQGLPWGLNLEVSAFKNLLDNQEVFVGPEQEISSTLSLDLLQNIGGVQDRARIDAAEKSLKAEQINLQDQVIRSCHRAIHLYASASFALARLEIFREQFEKAKLAFSIANRSYRQKIIRKIDLLSAKSDMVSAESQWVAQKADARRALDEMFIEAQEQAKESLDHESYELEAPDQFMQISSAKVEGWKSSRRATAARLLKDSAKRNLEATKMAQRASLQAGVRAEFQDQVQNFSDGTGAALFDVRNETVTVFLQMDWPWNRTNGARVVEAKANQLRAEALNIETLKAMENEFLGLVRDQEALSIRLKASESRADVLKQRMNSGLKLVKSGKLDFDEYIRYANAYFAESSDQIQIRSDIVANQLGFYNFSRDPVKLCQEVL